MTAGKVLPLPLRAHAHISPIMDDDKFNYSHRITQFSLGARTAGLVQPLEGDEVIADQGLPQLLAAFIRQISYSRLVIQVP